MTAEAVRGRTGWDLALGALLVLVGVVLLGHTVLATVVSVLFVGWLVLAAGVATLAVSLLRMGEEGFWTGLLGGGLLTVLGLVMLRNVGAAALTLTLVAGAMFLSTGVARLVAAVQHEEARVPLVISGSMSALLGLLIVFNLFTATLTLLGLLLAIEVISEGVAIMVAGRRNVAMGGLGRHTAVAG